MPISAGNLVIAPSSNGTQQVLVTSTPNGLAVQPLSPVEPTSAGVSADPREAVLIVNGKQKKIGKKSQYLLDMLSLDE